MPLLRGWGLRFPLSSLSYLIPTLAIVPSLIWIGLDDSTWGGDQSQYGQAALNLFFALGDSLGAWLSFLFEAFPSKPNGLIWIGQFFVPLAHITDSIDKALLFSVALIQLLSLRLMYRAIQTLAPGTILAPLIGCLGMASAPLFIGLGHVYLVEPLQALSVTWFILIMALAPTWSRALVLSQLLAASAVAMAVKESQPLFCVWPGLVALSHVFLPRAAPAGTGSSADAGGDRARHAPLRRERHRDRPPVGLSSHDGRAASPDRNKILLSLAFGVPLAVLTLAWYYRNLRPVAQHVHVGAFGLEFWGKDNTYLNKVGFWIRAAAEGFSFPRIWGWWLLVVAGGVMYFVLTSRRPPKRLTLCAAVAALQIVTVLLVCAWSPARAVRFLFPVLPYFALVLAWSVAQIRLVVVAGLVVAALAAQFVLLHAQALNLIPSLAPFVVPLQHHAKATSVLKAVVERTCQPIGRMYVNVLAIDRKVRKDWLAPEPANYVVAKNRFWRQQSYPSCIYDYLGGAYFGTTVPKAWNRLVAYRAVYFITTDPDLYPPPRRAMNQGLDEENFPVILSLVRTSGLFVSEVPLQEDPGILIFRRIGP